MSLRKPKRLTSKRDRENARRARDMQWDFMDRVAAHGTVWACWWNKNRHHEQKTLYNEAGDLAVFCLFGGMEFLEWLNSHKDWWQIGDWSDERYAAPVSLTEAGKAALKEREKYDMELVTGGLVEPGFCVLPSRKRR